MSFQFTAGRFRAFDNYGNPLVGGKLYSYASGTTTAKATYTDSTLTTPNTNPILLDARGEADVWLGSGAYTFTLRGPDDVLIGSEDGIAAPEGAGSAAALSATLAGSTGAEHIGFGPQTVDEALRERLSVTQFGAVADGAWIGTVATGTDNLSAFNTALAAAVTLGVTRVKASGHFRLSGPFIVPRGVILEGDGPAHLQALTSGVKRGTALLIPGASSGFCATLAENGSHSGLRDLSVFNTTTNAVTGVVGIVGHLYPELHNVEIASLRRSLGSGLYIKPSTTGALYETLWGTFRNVKVIVDQVGTANEASVRWGLDLVGVSSSSRPNANAFFGGQLSGTWGAMRSDGAASGSGALSAVFFGTKFDAIWDAATPFSALYRAAADGVFGWTKANCYIWPVVQIKKGFNTAFHGCYFEAAGGPATYTDGTNGSASLICTVWVDSAAECIGTGVIDANWNGVYLYDKGARTLVTPTTDGHKYDTRLATNLAVRMSGVQSVPNVTWTKVATPLVMFGDDSHLEWDATNGISKVRGAGAYIINGQAEFAGFGGAGTFVTSRITITGASPMTFGGSYAPQNGSGNAISTQANPPCVYLNAGDTVAFEVFHNQGAAQNTSGANTFLSVTKVS